MAISAHSFQFKSIRFDLKTNFLSHMIFLFFSFFHSNCKVYFYRICAFYRNIVHFCLLFLSLYSVAIYLPIFNFCKERKNGVEIKKNRCCCSSSFQCKILVSQECRSFQHFCLFTSFFYQYLLFIYFVLFCRRFDLSTFKCVHICQLQPKCIFHATKARHTD